MSSNFDFVEGETIVLRANLRKDRWKCYRCVRCTLSCTAASLFAPLCMSFYALFGGVCRQQEADSFELVLTNQNIHFRQKIYTFGVCCHQTQSKVIPLHRIQDISLVSDWMGDSCGIVDTPGEPYILLVQTAAMGGMMPELCVFCIEHPREFKQKVLEAKNRLGAGVGAVGQTKEAATPSAQASVAGMSQEELLRVLTLMQQQQQAHQAPFAGTAPPAQDPKNI